MFDSDKQQFARVVRSTMLVCGGDAPDADVLRIWWASLLKFDITEVSAAFSQYAQRGKFAPKPADILEIIDRMKPDGRPGVEEAWAMIPKDEHVSAVMTEEIAEAYGIAAPLLNDGETTAARMAFKEAYSRIVERNKLAGISPKWFPSLGRDPEMRATVLQEAVRLGRIGAEHAERIMPPDILNLPNSATRLAIEDKTPEQRELNRKRIAEAVAELAKKNSGNSQIGGD